MRKISKLVIGIIVVVLILILGVYFFRSGGGKFDEQTLVCIEECEEDTCINNCKDEYYFINAKEEGSLDSCSKISSENYKEGCEDLIYYRISLSENDIYLCDNIVEDNLNEMCKRRLIFYQANEEKDIGVCDKLNDWPECKDIIRINIAYFDNDLSFCEQIIDSEIREICFNSVVIRKVRVERDISLCEKILDDSIRESCTLIAESAEVEEKLINEGSGLVDVAGKSPLPIGILTKEERDPIWRYLNLY